MEASTIVFKKSVVFALFNDPEYRRELLRFAVPNCPPAADHNFAEYDFPHLYRAIGGNRSRIGGALHPDLLFAFADPWRHVYRSDDVHGSVLGKRG